VGSQGSDSGRSNSADQGPLYVSGNAKNGRKNMFSEHLIRAAPNCPADADLKQIHSKFM
jgi:hypothetical protein